MLRKTLLILVCALWCPCLVQGASFDCSRALTAVERTICGSEELSAADDKLAEAYRRALAATEDRKALKREQ